MITEFNGLELTNAQIDFLKTAVANRTNSETIFINEDFGGGGETMLGTEAEFKQAVIDCDWGRDRYLRDENNRYATLEDAQNEVFEQEFANAKEIDEETIKMFLA